MPTILDLGFCRIVIYPNDHRPAHVHAIGPDWEAVVQLNCPDGLPTLRESFNVNATTFRRVIRAVVTNQTILCNAWTSIHDHN